MGHLLGAGQADLRPVDRRRVEVHEQVVVAEPGHRSGDRRLAADAVQGREPAGGLGHEEQVTAADLAAVDEPAQQRLVGDDGAVGERDDRLVGRPELRLGQDAHLRGHAAAGELDGQAGRGQQAGGAGGTVPRRVGGHPDGLQLGGGEVAREPLEEPVDAPAALSGRRRRPAAGRCSIVETERRRGARDGRQHVGERGWRTAPVPRCRARPSAYGRWHTPPADGSHASRMAHRGPSRTRRARRGRGRPSG